MRSRYARTFNPFLDWEEPTLSENSIEHKKDGEKIQVVVKITKTIFLKPETKFGIFAIVTEEGDDTSMKGVFPFHVEEDTLKSYYQVTGEVASYNGRKQISFKTCKSTYPFLKEDVMIALKANYGFKQSPQRLFQALGDFPLKEIDKNLQKSIKKLAKYGITEKEVKEIHSHLDERDVLETEYNKLIEMGLSEKEANTLMAEYFIQSSAVLLANPYFCSEKGYVGFSTADKIALENGTLIDNPQRLSAVLGETIKKLTYDEGHTLCLKNDFLTLFPLMAGYSMGAVEAKSLIKNTTAPSIPYQIGNNKSEIVIADLEKAMKRWQNTPVGMAKPPFLYPRCPVDPETLAEVVDHSLDKKLMFHIEKDSGDYFQHEAYHYLETNIAERLYSLNKFPGKSYSKKQIKTALEKSLQAMEVELGHPVSLEPEQESAVYEICSSSEGVFLLTGPAGSGKTFTIQVIIRVLTILLTGRKKKNACFPIILAPTGQAAQIAHRATGTKAETIHKHYGIQDQNTVKNPPNVSDPDREQCNLYMIDETSMIDTSIMSITLEYLPSDVKLVFLGDEAQLPSVGAGNCLRDIIRSGIVPHCKLTTVKRQGEKSAVLANANKIIRGEPIESAINNKDGIEDNAYHIPISTEDAIAQELVRMAKGCGLPGFHQGEFQILCAMKKGIAGVDAINYAIQRELNPYKEDFKVSKGKGYDKVQTSVFVTGDNDKPTPVYIHIKDKVINVKNNYEAVRYYRDDVGNLIEIEGKGIMNGETGVVQLITRDVVKDTHTYTKNGVEKEKIIKREVPKVIISQEVMHEGAPRTEYVEIKDSGVKDLLLAYAITIHKSQGAQWPVVAAPFHHKNFRMHYRQLLYTMYTRAQSTCFTLGNLETVNYCVKRSLLNQRQTGLLERLSSL